MPKEKRASMWWSWAACMDLCLSNAFAWASGRAIIGFKFSYLHELLHFLLHSCARIELSITFLCNENMWSVICLTAFSLSLFLMEFCCFRKRICYNCFKIKKILKISWYRQTSVKKIWTGSWIAVTWLVIPPMMMGGLTLPWMPFPWRALVGKWWHQPQVEACSLPLIANKGSLIGR